jgi:hypothetical protein
LPLTPLPLKDDKVVYVPPEPKNITLDSPIPDKNETFVRKILWNILKGIFITCMFLFCYSMYLWNKEENQYNDELNNMTDIYARNYCKQEHLEYDKFGTVIYGKNDSNRTNVDAFINCGHKITLDSRTFFADDEQHEINFTY